MLLEGALLPHALRARRRKEYVPGATPLVVSAVAALPVSLTTRLFLPGPELISTM